MENTFDDHIGASRNSGFSRTPRKMSRDSTFRTRTQSLASNGSQEGGGAKQVKVIFGSIFFVGIFENITQLDSGHKYINTSGMIPKFGSYLGFYSSK